MIALLSRAGRFSKVCFSNHFDNGPTETPVRIDRKILPRSKPTLIRPLSIGLVGVERTNLETIMHELITVIRKRPEISAEDFRRFMEHEYGPVYAALPQTRRYVHYYLHDLATDGAEPPIDAIVQTALNRRRIWRWLSPRTHLKRPRSVVKRSCKKLLEVSMRH